MIVVTYNVQVNIFDNIDGLIINEVLNIDEKLLSPFSTVKVINSNQVKILNHLQNDGKLTVYLDCIKYRIIPDLLIKFLEKYKNIGIDNKSEHLILELKTVRNQKMNF